MAARTLSAARARLRRTETASLVSPGAALLALSVPVVFLHETYQPSWSVSLGSTTATMYLADVAVLVVGAAAIVVALQEGIRALRPGRWLFALAGALLVWILIATLYGPAVIDGYRFATHAVTAAKFWEYALLAVAVPLLARRTADLWLLIGTLVVWSAVATSVGALQFVGIVDDPFRGHVPGQREPSFLGPHDFAAVSGAALAVGLLALVLAPLDRRVRRLAAIGGVAGGLGLVLSGAVSGVIGVAGAAVAALVIARRRATVTLARASAAVAVVGVVGIGVVAIRSAEIDSVLRFVGIRPAEEGGGSLEGASQAQRTVLAYIGGRIFFDHPLLGVGWQGTSEEASYAPYLEDARERFPHVPPRSFPSPEHPWGIQNVYVQAAADMGVVGLGLMLAPFAAGIALAARGASRAPPERALLAALPAAWLCVIAGIWLGLGVVAGIPIAALSWLALGMAAAVATWARVERA